MGASAKGGICMNAEYLHDAISLLPDDLLVPVDKLRQRKPIPWKSVAALAACACLIVGLWSFLPNAGGTKGTDNGAIIEPGDGFGGIIDDVVEESTTCAYLSATVLEVDKGHITVLPGADLTDVAEPITVKLDRLETIPALEAGQKIKLYYSKFPDNSQPLVPYRIEIIED
jgi:hypothetical protein